MEEGMPCSGHALIQSHCGLSVNSHWHRQQANGRVTAVSANAPNFLPVCRLLLFEALSCLIEVDQIRSVTSDAPIDHC